MGKHIKFRLNSNMTKNIAIKREHPNFAKRGEKIQIISEQQNPVEYIWLQAKSLIREFYFFCHSFSIVKGLFELLIPCQIFDFPKLHEYGVF